VEEVGGIFVKSFHECSILGEADFLMEALIAWSLKRKYLWQELLVIVYTEQCIFSKQLHFTQGFFFICWIASCVLQAQQASQAKNM